MITPEKLKNIYNKEWCRRHLKPPINLLNLLHHRELGNRKPGTHFLRGSREFYQCYKLVYTSFLPPTNFTPIRFTPDGQQLVSFNIANQLVKLQWYNGITSIRRSDITNARPILTNHFSISTDRFERQTYLSREVCLITSDSRHMIIAYVARLPDNAAVLNRLTSNNESVSPTNDLEHTVFLSIDLMKGTICDTLRMEFNSIRMSTGVYLVNRLFGVLSVQHQVVRLYKIDKNNGNFRFVREIGRQLYEDDPVHFKWLDKSPAVASIEKCYTGFRQRFMSFLYKKKKQCGKGDEFLRSSHNYRMLKMQGMQFIGSDLLLIRVGAAVSSEHNTRKEDEKIPYMFLIYEWQTTEIVAVFNRSSERLFNLFVNFSEHFRHGSILANNFPTTMEHCHSLRQHHDSIIAAWVATSSPESSIEVRKRVLNVLPCTGIGVPVFTPFLDAHYFSFEERLLPCIENACFPTQNNAEIRIFARKTSSPVLQVLANQLTEQDVQKVRILFHPTDMLLLVTDRICNDSTIHVFTPPINEE